MFYSFPVLIAGFTSRNVERSAAYNVSGGAKSLGKNAGRYDGGRQVKWSCRASDSFMGKGCWSYGKFGKDEKVRYYFIFDIVLNIIIIAQIFW